MSSSKELEIRDRFGRFMQLNPEMSATKIVKHFMLEGVPERTGYSIIARLKSGQGVARKPGSGQNTAIDQKIEDKIIEFAVNEVGLSYRQIGRKFTVDHHSVETILTEAGVQRVKRKKCSKSTEKQTEKQKKCLQKLYANGWTAKNWKQLKRRIEFIIRNLPENLCQNLMKNVKSNVRKAADRGVLSVIKPNQIVSH